MDTKRIFTSQYLKQLKKLYKIKYKDTKFDLILSSDNNALDFLLKNRDELFGDVPTSFCGVNFFKDSDLNGHTNYTGAAEFLDAKQTIQTAIKLYPKVKNIYVIDDYLTTGRAWNKTIKIQLKDINKKIIYAPNQTIEELQNTLKSLPKNTIVLLGVYFKDKNGKFFTYEKIGKMIVASSNAPVFCLLKFNFVKGVVGGSMIGGYYQGLAMSKIGLKILNGVKVSDIPVVKKGATKLIFNYNAMKKYNMNISELPSDAIILNQPSSYYKNNKQLILASAIIAVSLLIIIIILLKNLKKRKEAERLLVISKQNIENKIKTRTNELQNQKDNFEYLFNNTIETIGIFQNSKCVDINKAGVKLFGASNKQELIGKEALSFIAPDSIEIASQHIKNEKLEPYEANAIKLDGAIFPVLIQGQRKIINKIPTRITSVLDLSDMKENEKKIEYAKDKAQQATKVKSEFLANMSHEIRTPMNGIIGMSHLVLQTNLDNKQKNYIQKIDSSAKSLLNIINDILDFSKIEAGKLEINKIDFDIRDLINNVKNIVKNKADEKRLDLIVECECDKNSMFYGDNLRISQILVNLINNAIKFTSKGLIKIIIKKNNDDMIRFEIEDTGIGISKENQKRLFQPFNQADGSTTRKYGGTGLGLSISKQLVELMDGKIWVESEIDKGSKFAFELKLPKGKIVHLQQEKVINANIKSLKGSNILLVEDNLINQEIVVGLLEESDINIDIASNGKEAVEMFKKGQDKYELLLMDIQMPIMDGYEATKIIREIDEALPIIALTANAMKEDAEKTKAVGMQEHLNKPIEVQKLYEILLKYISKKIEIKDAVEDSMKDITKDVDFENFKNIDARIGLSYMGGNLKLYKKILKDFYTNYQNLKLENLDNTELHRVAHTIKGLSANMGAKELSDISKELEDTLDITLFDKLYAELDKVLKELENMHTEIQDTNFLELDTIKRDELFSSIKESAKRRRIKGCKTAVAKLEMYNLNSTDKQLLKQINELLHSRKYQEIMDIDI